MTQYYNSCELRHSGRLGQIPRARRLFVCTNGTFPNDPSLHSYIYHAGVRQSTRNNVALTDMPNNVSRRDYAGQACSPLPLSHDRPRHRERNTPIADDAHLRSICSPSIVHMKNLTPRPTMPWGRTPPPSAERNFCRIRSQVQRTWTPFSVQEGKAKGRLPLSAFILGGWLCRTLGGQDWARRIRKLLWTAPSTCLPASPPCDRSISVSAGLDASKGATVNSLPSFRHAL